MTRYIQMVHCVWNVFDLYLFVKINLGKLIHNYTKDVYCNQNIKQKFYASKRKEG